MISHDADRIIGKIRRVKCDETRPTCVRCKKYGFPCDGYQIKSDQIPPQRELLQKRTLPSLKPSYQFPATFARVSSEPKFLNELEYQYFAAFQFRAAPELCGYFETDIWNSLVLQISHREEYARHAVIAIAALHRSLDEAQRGGHDFPRRGHGLDHYMTSIKHYGKALRLMQELSREDNDTFVHNTLISTILIFCYESFIGNQDDALRQAELGIGVLFQWQAKRYAHLPAREAWTTLNSTSFLDEDILGTFARIDTLLMLFKDMHGARHPFLQGMTMAGASMPVIFSSIKEARIRWDNLIQKASHWRCAFPQESFATLEFGANSLAQEASEERIILVRKFQCESELYLKILRGWYNAFVPIFHRARSLPGTKAFLGASVLMLKYLSLITSIPSAFAVYETVLEARRDDFMQAIELARDILETSQQIRSQGKAIFVFDENIVCALFIVATKCRDGWIRRQAIALLWKYPRREGLWDSSMAAKIAAWIMNVEERGMVNSFVPEMARLTIVQNEFVLSERKAVIQCSKLDECSGERILLPEVTLTW